MTQNDPFDGLTTTTAMPSPMWHELAKVACRRPWDLLRQRYGNAVRQDVLRWVAPDQPHYRQQLEFALGRFDEGAALLNFFAGQLPQTMGRPLRVLDVGAGNGGVALALANCSAYSVFTADLVPNANLRSLRRDLGLPVMPLVGNGERMPVTDSAFDVILLLDMIEHVPHPRALGREVMRMLKPGGVCMVTTPPRLRYMLRPDPHYGVRYLVMFPNFIQRQIVNRVVNRRVKDAKGGDADAYDVQHIFWHVREVARYFPASDVEVLYDVPLNPGKWFNRDWWNFKAREFFWDRILIHKRQEIASATNPRKGVV